IHRQRAANVAGYASQALRPRNAGGRARGHKRAQVGAGLHVDFGAEGLDLLHAVQTENDSAHAAVIDQQIAAAADYVKLKARLAGGDSGIRHVAHAARLNKELGWPADAQRSQLRKRQAGLDAVAQTSWEGEDA